MELSRHEKHVAGARAADGSRGSLHVGRAAQGWQRIYMHVCLCVDDIGLVNNCRRVLHYTCTYVLSAVCQVFANICSLQQFVLYITSDLPSPYSHVCSCMSTGTGEPPSLVHYMSHCHITLLVPECLYFQMCVCMLLCACMFAFCAQESTCQALRSMCMHANTVSTLISQLI